MKGQFMLISGIVAGLILISTAFTISEIQSQEFNPDFTQKDISHIKQEARELNLTDEHERRQFRNLVNSMPGYSTDVSYWKSEECFNVTLRRQRNFYQINCAGKDIQKLEGLILELVNLNDFNSKGSHTRTSASRGSLSGDLGIGYRNGNPGDSLKGYWRLDGLSSTVYDYSGEGNNGDNNGATGGVNGIFSTDSRKFDGNDYIEIQNMPSLDGEQEFTASLWVNSESTNTDASVFGTRTGLNTDENLGLRYDKDGFFGSGNNVIKAAVETQNGYSQIETESNVQITEWQHIVLRWSSGRHPEVFLDGSELSYSYVSGTISGSLEVPRFLIGKGLNDNSGYWNGRIDEFRVYSKFLNKAQIKKLYLNGRTGDFNGSYSSKWVDLKDKQKVKNLSVNSTLPSGTSAKIHLNHSSGSSDTVNLQSGSYYKNYSVSMPAGGSVEINAYLTSSEEELSPLIKEVRLWSNAN